jgi:hypothetical protein
MSPKNGHLRRTAVRSEVRRAAAGRLDRLAQLEPDPRALELPEPKPDPRQLQLELGESSGLRFVALDVEGDDQVVAAALQLAGELMGGRHG